MRFVWQLIKHKNKYWYVLAYSIHLDAYEGEYESREQVIEPSLMPPLWLDPASPPRFPTKMYSRAAEIGWGKRRPTPAILELERHNKFVHLEF